MMPTQRIFTVLTFCCFAATAQQYTISTIAGGGGPLPLSNTAAKASIGNVYATAADRAGDIYFSIYGAVMKVSPNGVLTAVAGNGMQGYTGDGGPATRAKISTVEALAIDQYGNLYLADTQNNVVRKVFTDGTITTIAGNGGRPGDGPAIGDGGPATEAPLFFPEQLAVDTAVNVYIGERNRPGVRKVNPVGIITTAVGNGTAGYSGDGGPASSAQIGAAWGLAVDNAGNLYISDVTPARHSSVSAARIRKVTPDGTITTIAGTGVPGYSGDGGPGLSAQFSNPGALAVDDSGNLYIADLYRIRELSANGTINTIGGNGTQGFAGDGGPAAAAEISGSAGGSGDRLAIGSTGSLYIADTANSRIRTIAAGGTIQTAAGNGGLCCYEGDGSPGNSIELNLPLGVAVDAAGNTYISDTYNNFICKVSPAGILTTVAGLGPVAGSPGDGGPAVNAAVKLPAGMTIDPSGNLYVAEAGGYRIRMINPAGIITTVAGTGVQGSAWSFEGSAATAANLTWPEDVAVDASGNLYVADTGAGAIRKITPAGIITTVAGNNTAGFSGDGGPATRAQLNVPTSVAVDGTGNLYFADTYNFRIRKISPDGTITTIAGTGHPGYFGDGIPAASARLAEPLVVRVDAAGNLYLADFSTVRLITPDGIIHTLAGTGVPGYSGDGGPATSAQLFAWGLALNGAADIYIASWASGVVRLLPSNAKP
jgi:sugar lactone lactonase YvrE